MDCGEIDFFLLLKSKLCEAAIQLSILLVPSEHNLVVVHILLCRCSFIHGNRLSHVLHQSIQVFIDLILVSTDTAMSLLGECRDINGLAVKHGLMYMAGPGECHQCICENGVPKNCQDVMCHQPQVLLSLLNLLNLK